MVTLDPVLGKKLIAGSLARIKRSNPDYYRFVVAELSKLDTSTDWNNLGGFMDAVGSIASNFGTVLQNAGTAYANVLVNRENAKTAAIIANDNVKAQIAVMNNELKLKQAQSTNAYATAHLQQQQAALYDTGNMMTGGGNKLMTWLPLVIVAAGAGYFLLFRKKAA